MYVYLWKLKPFFTRMTFIVDTFIYQNDIHTEIKFHLYKDESQKWNSLQNFGQFHSNFQLKFVINWSTLNMFNDFSPFKMWKTTKKMVNFFAISLPKLINIFKEQLVFHWTRNFSFHLFLLKINAYIKFMCSLHCMR